MDLRPGDRVYGPTDATVYEIIEPCGSGQFGVVFKIRDTESSAILALKTITTAWLDASTLAALQNEGGLATQIVHDNVLRVYYFHDGQTYEGLPPYMVMEYADGGTLHDLIAEHQRSESMFSNDELASMFRSLASGMKAINARLVHRDIKPDNILISGRMLKISDFGLSKVVGAATRSSTFKGINHIRYCAPEAWHLETNTPSMDMYSMGIVFYELATLLHPYSPEARGNIVDAWKKAHMTKIPDEPYVHNGSIASGLNHLIMKMIAKRAADRYRNWDDVLVRIETDIDPAPHALNVERLVRKVEATRTETETKRIKEEEYHRKAKERAEVLEHCFLEIVQACEQVADAFNKRTDNARLRVSYHPPCSITFSGQHGFVSVHVQDVDHNWQNEKIPKELRGKPIRAWGFVSTRSGRGFNLLLVAEGPDDLYGRWITLHVRHNPMYHGQDDRPEPFHFNMGELPREIHLIDALHVFVTEVKPFEASMLLPLIEETL